MLWFVLNVIRSLVQVSGLIVQEHNHYSGVLIITLVLIILVCLVQYMLNDKQNCRGLFLPFRMLQQTEIGNTGLKEHVEHTSEAT